MIRMLCLSGGKDSTRLLGLLLEQNIKLDYIVFADTTFEFPSLYDYLDKLESFFNVKIIRLQPPKSFESWMYGIVTRGKHKGKTRGFPLRAFPCYWSREAKVIPLQKFAKQHKVDVMYVGIAYDEKQRCSKNQPNLEYPLVDQKITEADCIKWLNENNLFNHLYVNFNRLGCYLCPKQNDTSIYVIWKLYPELWIEIKKWEKKNIQLGRGIIFHKSIKEYTELFNNNWIPKKRPKYMCWDGCESVKYAFQTDQKQLTDFT